MMSAKLATPALLKRKKFQNKGYDAIILDFDITKEILSCNSNYTVDEVMWSKFSNSNISVLEVLL